MTLPTLARADGRFVAIRQPASHSATTGLRRHAWLLLLALYAVPASSPASGQQSAPAAPGERATPFDSTTPGTEAIRKLAGCYALTVGAWSDERAPGSYVTIPSRIRLDTARVDRHQPDTLGSPRRAVAGDERELKGRPAWSPVGRDSLQVLAWANGTSAVHLFLRRRAAGRLEGIARFFWDVIYRDPVTKRWLWERYPTAPATLTAVPCA